MIENNETLNTSNDNDNISSSTGSTSGQTAANGNDLGNTTFTQEEIEAANKPQPNVILSKVADAPDNGTRDNLRVAERANEASDSTDTNTGGIVAGAAKGANQS